MSDLDHLLENLHPSRTLDETSARADHALNTFPVSHAMTEDFVRFQGLLTRFCLHVQKTILRLRSSYEGDPDHDWWLCCQMLAREYGRSNAWKAAFECVRTNNEGGIVRVFRCVAQGLAEEYSTREISARARHYLNQLSHRDKMAAAREYVAKYGHLLPSELTEGSAARIVDNFAEVLALHPRLLRKLRKVGQ